MRAQTCQQRPARPEAALYLLRPGLPRAKIGPRRARAKFPNGNSRRRQKMESFGQIGADLGSIAVVKDRGDSRTHPLGTKTWLLRRKRVSRGPVWRGRDRA